jgi:predicted lysophospholipase L1 biosynthesis ABC-type transport system permease subunit
MGYRKSKDDSSRLIVTLTRWLAVAISIIVGITIDAIFSDVTQAFAQKAMPDNAAFSVLWHILISGAAAVTVYAVLSKLISKIIGARW